MNLNISDLIPPEALPTRELTTDSRWYALLEDLNRLISADPVFTSAVLGLFGPTVSGLAVKVNTDLALTTLARLIIEHEAARHDKSVPPECLEWLLQIEAGLASLAEQNYPTLTQSPDLPGDNQTSEDKNGWILRFFLATSGSSFDRYAGLRSHYYLVQQSYHLQQHREVRLETFVRTRILPLQRLAQTLDCSNWPSIQSLSSDQEARYYVRDQARLAYQSLCTSHTIPGFTVDKIPLHLSVLEKLLTLPGFEAAISTAGLILTAKDETLPGIPITEGNDLTNVNQEIRPLENALLVPWQALHPNSLGLRQLVEEEGLAELAQDIARRGILEPLLVRPLPSQRQAEPNEAEPRLYEIVAGMRRWEAAGRAGLEWVPVIVRDMDQGEAELTALVENVQREDLDPRDEQRFYQTLQSRYNLGVEEIAHLIGKSRHYVSRRLNGSLVSFTLLSEAATNEREVIRDDFHTPSDTLPLLDISQPERDFSGVIERARPAEIFPTLNLKSFVRFDRAVSTVLRTLEEDSPQFHLAHIESLKEVVARLSQNLMTLEQKLLTFHVSLSVEQTVELDEGSGAPPF